MIEFIRPWFGVLVSALRARAALQAENLALRHQLCVYQRSVKRPKVCYVIAFSSASPSL